MNNHHVKQRDEVLGASPKPKLVTSLDSAQAKSTQPSARGRTADIMGAPLAHLPSDGEQRRGVYTDSRKAYSNQRVPVLDKNNNPLMPTIPSRARRWVKNNKATPFWKNGIWCVRLNVEPSDSKKQSITIGIDPGSKFEGFTVKSAKATFINIQADAVTWVKQNL